MFPFVDAVALVDQTHLFFRCAIALAIAFGSAMYQAVLRGLCFLGRPDLLLPDPMQIDDVTHVAIGWANCTCSAHTTRPTSVQWYHTRLRSSCICVHTNTECQQATFSHKSEKFRANSATYLNITRAFESSGRTFHNIKFLTRPIIAGSFPTAKARPLSQRRPSRFISKLLFTTDALDACELQVTVSSFRIIPVSIVSRIRRKFNH